MCCSGMELKYCLCMHTVITGQKHLFPKYKKIPFAELYRRTGCQFQPFTSIYQLYADKMEGRLVGVTDMMMPEYLLYKLCGGKVREYTEATTMPMISKNTNQTASGPNILNISTCFLEIDRLTA